MPPNTVKVDRTTLFGNPFLVRDYGHDRAIALYRDWITGKALKQSRLPAPMHLLKHRRQQVLMALPTLRGRNLACWCPLPRDAEPDSCHAETLLQLANS